MFWVEQKHWSTPQSSAHMDNLAQAFAGVIITSDLVFTNPISRVGFLLTYFMQFKRENVTLNSMANYFTH